MALPIGKLSGEAVIGLAYKSNLTAFKGSVFGGQEYGVFDGFVTLANWLYEYEQGTGNLYVWKEIGSSERYTILNGNTGISELSFTFDKQMLPVVSYIKASKSFIYYFDSLENIFITKEIPNAKEPKVALNSVHFSHIRDSNVVLGYIKDEKTLCIRLQEDRYTIEYVVKVFPSKVKLYNIGYADTNRFQYEVLESMV